MIRRYGQLEERFSGLGGYAAEAEAARICSHLGLPERVLGQPLGTLSGGQRRRIELARILFADSAGEPTTLLLDEPTNHLDADSITWLRDFLKGHKGGLIVISHDVDLLDAVVNKVWYLDANRANLDVYNVGWRTYLKQREADERRRHRERANAERKIDQLRGQADKMRAKATKARAAQQMLRRADALSAGMAELRVADKVAKLRFPDPAPCGRTPLTAEGLSKSYGSLEVFADVDLADRPGDPGRRVGAQRRGQDDPAAATRRAGISRHRRDKSRARAAAGLLRPGARDPGHRADGAWRTCVRLRPNRPICNCAAPWAPSSSPVTTSRNRPVCCPVVRRPGWPWPCWYQRGQRTAVGRAYEQPGSGQPGTGSGRASALRRRNRARHPRRGRGGGLNPDKVILLPDGVEDSWSADLADLIALA